jgi:hypothetical protein
VLLLLRACALLLLLLLLPWRFARQCTAVQATQRRHRVRALLRAAAT